MKKRWIAAAMACTMTASLLAGCSSGSGQTEAGTQAESAKTEAGSEAAGYGGCQERRSLRHDYLYNMG